MFPILALSCAPLIAWQQEQAPKFEVASVKVNPAGEAVQSKISTSEPGRFIAANVPVRFVLLYAFDLRDHQLVDAPKWTDSVSVDIVGTYPAGSAGTEDNIRRMVQELLKDRFALAVHKDQRDLPSFSMVLARKDGQLGPNMSRSDVDCKEWLAQKKPQANAGGPSSVTPSGKRSACMTVATRTWMAGGTRTTAQLATSLQSMVGRPVVDHTGLPGAYDFDLKWSRLDASEDATTADTPSLFTAIQEQLGLKLIAERNRFDVLVVDHIIQPSPN